MSIREQIMQMAAGQPDVKRAVDAIEIRLGATPIMPDDLKQVIQILEFVLQNPDKYAEVRAAAIADGEIQEDMFPPEFDAKLIVSVLIALYGLQDRLSQKMAQGGLVMAARQLQRQGRGGDTELAHINPREAEMLRLMGGSGTVNPNTGLREYKGFFEFLGSILPIAASILLPGVGGIIGSALIGGISSAIGGGNILQGAVMGGLGAGLGSALGGGANNLLGLGLGKSGANILGNALVGGGYAALTGKDALQGAATGAIGGAIGNLAGGLNQSSALNRGLTSAGTTFGNALTVGTDPSKALTMAALSGAMGALRPSQTAVDNKAAGTAPNEITGASALMPENATYSSTAPGYKAGPSILSASGTPGTTSPNILTGTPSLPIPGTADWVQPSTPVAAAPPATKGGLGQYILPALAAYSALSGAPPAVQAAVPSMTPAQQEYFNRPAQTWNWDKLQQDAAASNMDVGQFMAQNWNKITQGDYNNPTTANVARGGALRAVATYARGSGDGRADTVHARLSDGEYVIDAETVALLGDGSNEEGARRLDKMRKEIRMHKGKVLAKGKFSPAAKSPLNYLKGAA
jgi:hypothetical protein